MSYQHSPNISPVPVSINGIANLLNNLELLPSMRGLDLCSCMILYKGKSAWNLSSFVQFCFNISSVKQGLGLLVGALYILFVWFWFWAIWNDWSWPEQLAIAKVFGINQPWHKCIAKYHNANFMYINYSVFSQRSQYSPSTCFICICFGSWE